MPGLGSLLAKIDRGKNRPALVHGENAGEPSRSLAGSLRRKSAGK
jgi:hypothetical protein